MPNHVTTVITAPKEVLDALTSFEGDVVNFGLLVPEPENLEQGNCNGTHAEGVVCWRDWNIANWGTKWNAYDEDRLSDTKLKFDTAWSHPEPIIHALAEKFVGQVIEVEYADEDLGQNLGHYYVKSEDGELFGWVEEFEAGSAAANEFAAQVKFGQSYEDLMAQWGE